MITITYEQLRKVCPQGPKNLADFIPYLNEYMAEYKIDTLNRVQPFIAQVAHESGQFNYLQEIASGAAYEGRSDLGNTHKGDGVKYKGHGLIQTTGRENHRLAGIALGLDLINNPLLLITPNYGTKSACWFWKSKGLSEIADTPDKMYPVVRKGKSYTLTTFEYITRKINGWLNGLEDRKLLWERTKEFIV